MLKAGNSDRVLPAMGRADMIIPARQNAAVAKEQERKDIKMRELKFRVYDKHKKQYIKTCYNNTFAVTAEGKIIHYWFHDNWDYPRSHSANLPYLVIQQYTGLKDNNGQEIYEGDIVEWQSHIGYREEVVFSDGVFWATSIPLYEVAKNAEVIGNNFENLELLK
jgi:hypothetical protein